MPHIIGGYIDLMNGHRVLKTIVYMSLEDLDTKIKQLNQVVEKLNNRKAALYE